MESKGGLIDRLGEFYSRLSPRERTLAVIWVFAMGFIVVFIFSTKVLGGIEELEDKVASNVEMIDLIEKKKADYLANAGSGTEDIQSRIAGNQLKLTTFLDKEAGQHELKIDNFKESSSPVGGKRGKKSTKGGVTEESVTVEINRADIKNVMRFLDSIKRSKELIVIKRIRVKRPRRNRGQSYVEATVTVSTFKRQES